MVQYSQEFHIYHRLGIFNLTMMLDRNHLIYTIFDELYYVLRYFIVLDHDGLFDVVLDIIRLKSGILIFAIFIHLFEFISKLLNFVLFLKIKVGFLQANTP